MNPPPKDRSKIYEAVEEESSDHEWAEFNLPFAMLLGLPDEEDNLAFVGLGTSLDDDPPASDS